MDLSQLFSRGSKLSDVPPDYVGMPYAEWDAKSRTVAELYKANAKAIADHWRKFEISGEPPLADRKITTPRDDYGNQRPAGALRRFNHPF